MVVVVVVVILTGVVADVVGEVGVVLFNVDEGGVSFKKIKLTITFLKYILIFFVLEKEVDARTVTPKPENSVLIKTF